MRATQPTNQTHTAFLSNVDILIEDQVQNEIWSAPGCRHKNFQIPKASNPCEIVEVCISSNKHKIFVIWVMEHGHRAKRRLMQFLKVKVWRKELQSFIGALDFFQRHMPKFSESPHIFGACFVVVFFGRFLVNSRHSLSVWLFLVFWSIFHQFWSFFDNFDRVFFLLYLVVCSSLLFGLLLVRVFLHFLSILGCSWTFFVAFWWFLSIFGPFWSFSCDVPPFW